MKHFSLSTILGLTFGILLAFGIVVSAFQSPQLAPPQGNVPAPLNVGPETQTKQGGLIISGGVDSPRVGTQQFCIGPVGAQTCKTAWPAAVSLGSDNSKLFRSGSGIDGWPLHFSVSDNNWHGLSYVGDSNETASAFSIPAGISTLACNGGLQTKIFAGTYCNTYEIRLICNGSTLVQAGYAMGDLYLRPFVTGPFDVSSITPAACKIEVRRDPRCTSNYGVWGQFTGACFFI